MLYRNPILKGDYSDPDVIRVGEDYYMTSSSFTYFPGLPILHSTDLAHWEIINHAAPRLPFDSYDEPRHKCGLWAPSIRYHGGLYYIYVCTPDEGLLVFRSADPRGTFDVHHIKDVSGWIDPCPFWDDDGQAYLIHAFSASRAGIKNRLFVHRMSADGLQILDDGVEVFTGDDVNITTEGPKLYKIEGVYWILCPSGGVPRGWQLALRSASIYGPYEFRRVLSQGDTPVNGPHQGGLVDTPGGAWWFIHFQDREAYGRVVHLQPVDWRDGFPVMGGRGAPVLSHEMPHG
jgi:beta-xylosidase